MSRNSVKNIVNLILSRALIEYDIREIGNVLVFEEKLLEGALQLDSEQIRALCKNLKLESAPLSMFGLTSSFEPQIKELLSNLLLFQRSRNLTPFLVNKFLEEFLTDCSMNEGHFVMEVFESETIDYGKDNDTTGFFYISSSPYGGDPYYDWGWGSKHRDRLGFSYHETKLLNRAGVGDTVFTEIQQCADESARLYLRLLRRIDKLLKAEGSSLELSLRQLDQSLPYHYWHTPSSQVYIALFKLSENAVRRVYRHSRKLDQRRYIRTLDELFAAVSVPDILAAIEEECKAIASLDPTTDTQLNAINSNRWKSDFQRIKEQVEMVTPKEIVRQLELLFTSNQNNPSLSKIYFDASNLLVKVNKVAALKAYLRYYHIRTKAAEATAKKISKTNLKTLFPKEKHLNDFVKLIQELSIQRDIEAVLQKVEKVYQTKKRQVKLDDEAIAQISRQQDETADRLGELLNEPGTKELNEALENQSEKLVSPEEPLLGLDSIFEAGSADSINLGFRDFQKIFIKMLLKNGGTLAPDEIQAFCKARNLFKSRLVDGINECFQEQFDDILLELDADGCRIIEDYIEEIKFLENVN